MAVTASLISGICRTSETRWQRSKLPKRSSMSIRSYKTLSLTAAGLNQDAFRSRPRTRYLLNVPLLAKRTPIADLCVETFIMLSVVIRTFHDLYCLCHISCHLSPSSRVEGLRRMLRSPVVAGHNFSNARVRPIDIHRK